MRLRVLPSLVSDQLLKLLFARFLCINSAEEEEKQYDPP